MKNIFCVIILCVISASANALDWTEESTVKYVRTYDGVDYSIGLNETRCENSKDYYQVQNKGNNDTFYSIALAALLSGKKVKIYYEVSSGGIHCYVQGIWIIQ